MLHQLPHPNHQLVKKLEFCQFITSILFDLLNRNDHRGESYLMLHKLLHHNSISAKTVTIPILVHALSLVYKVRVAGNFVVLNGSEPHLFAISLLICIKFSDDHSFGFGINKAWAFAMNSIGGISTQQVVQMEKDFLECLGYDVYLSHENYQKWLKYVVLGARDWERMNALRNNYQAPISPVSPCGDGGFDFGFPMQL